MDVEKKLGMSLDDLIKKTKPAKKQFIQKAFAGEKVNAKKKGAVVNKKQLKKASPGGKLGIRKAVTKRERKSDDEPMTGASRQRRVSINGKSKTKVVSNNSSSSRKTFSRKVVISKGPDAPGQQRKIKVQNIPYDLTWKDVKSALSGVGKIERCDVEHGEAVITFASHKEAQKAVQTYNGGDMNGRKIRVFFV
jgi:hypothetical protein